VLPLTEENVEKVLDEVRPSLMADGGNVALHEIDGLVVVLKLQGACGSCPSSTMTLKMGIETRLRDKIPDILEVEQIVDTETGLDLTADNVEKVSSRLDASLQIKKLCSAAADDRDQTVILRTVCSCRCLMRSDRTSPAPEVEASRFSRLMGISSRSGSVDLQLV